MPNTYWLRALTVEERFFLKVDKDGAVPLDRPELGNCWIWIGARNEKGYGRFSWEGRQGTATHFLLGRPAKPFVYDHLCRRHECVRPSHLQLVSQALNVLRGIGPLRMRARTHCPQGHEYTPENTIWNRQRHRRCRTCAIQRLRDMRAKAGKIPMGKRTHCPSGHPYIGANLYITSTGGRGCRICRKAKGQKYREEHREELRDYLRSWKQEHTTIAKH